MTRKEIAIDFIIETATHDVDYVFNHYLTKDFKHHNVYFKGDKETLRVAMKESRKEFPERTISILHVMEDGDYISVRSHMVMKKHELEVIAIHTFLFEEMKIKELWDTVQILPEEMVNEHGY